MKRESGLKHLNNLFDRYRTKLVAPERVVVETAVVVIAELYALTVTPAQLRYTPATRTLHIKHGMLRSELLPHRDELLRHLKNRLGSKSAPETIM
jgi:hypothetical protein